MDEKKSLMLADCAERLGDLWPNILHKLFRVLQDGSLVYLAERKKG